jgi:hypothetical protein
LEDKSHVWAAGKVKSKADGHVPNVGADGEVKSKADAGAVGEVKSEAGDVSIA